MKLNKRRIFQIYHFKLLAWIALLLEVGCGSQLAHQLVNINIFSDEEEVKLGRKFADKIETKLQFHRDLSITAYINDLGQRLVSHSKRQNINYHFKVVNAEEVNAFAIPGGYVYVNLGLIRFADTEAELAGVMAHEVGHVVGKHGMKQLTKQYGLAALAQLLLGKDPGRLEELATQVVTSGFLLKYSREAEREADLLATKKMHSAGINPAGMANFFEKLLSAEKRQPTKVEQLISTHPGTSERITNVRQQIQQLPPKSYDPEISTRFQSIKRRLS